MSRMHNCYAAQTNLPFNLTRLIFVGLQRAISWLRNNRTILAILRVSSP